MSEAFLNCFHIYSPFTFPTGEKQPWRLLLILVSFASVGFDYYRFIFSLSNYFFSVDSTLQLDVDPFSRTLDVCVGCFEFADDSFRQLATAHAREIQRRVFFRQQRAKVPVVYFWRLTFITRRRVQLRQTFTTCDRDHNHIEAYISIIKPLMYYVLYVCLLYTYTHDVEMKLCEQPSTSSFVAVAEVGGAR